MDVTHVNSEYVNVMQLSDLVSGVIKDHFMRRNMDLKRIIKRKLLKSFIKQKSGHPDLGHAFYYHLISILDSLSIAD